MANMSDDEGDWQHEVKRDKALDRIAELEAERDRLREVLIPLLADYEEARAEWNSPDTEIYADHLIAEARAELEGK